MTDWDTKSTPTFRRQYKNMGHYRQRSVDIATNVLRASENPADLGRYKQDGNFYAYKLSKGDRLVYKINRKDHIILLFRVCDHKSVYGKD